MQTDLFNQPELTFAGSDYDHTKDSARLTGQIKRIVCVMKDEAWRTLAEIEELTQAPQASISAQLRHLRKERFGNNEVNKRNRGDRATGLFEYQLIMNK